MTGRLLHGYAGPSRAAPCACGGFVSARPENALEVERAVMAHQRTIRHMDWWAITNKVWVVGRVVVTAEGTFLEPLQAGPERVP